ncbi:unnamed protein product [Heterobilharzia americana]|nr:unnamed protein product [Heterobilharzia americana]
MDLRTQEIHSGHFMVSNLEDSEDETEDSNDLGDDIPSNISKDLNDQPVAKDRNRLIFENLASLFKYLEIAYNGKLTSPKWDQFRGLRFAIKNKIRLNNIIWREYHMQYVKKLKPVVVQFQTPVCENHSKAEAVVLEGKYWRRRLSTLCKEYSLWRVFAKNKLCGSHNKQIVQCANELLEGSELCSYKFSDLSKNATSKLLEEIMMDIDENLDLFFEQPLTFPNPRDLPTLGNADIMQPGLQQLQPNRSLREDMSSSMFQSSEPNLSSQNYKYSISSDVYPSNHMWSTASNHPEPTFEEKCMPKLIHCNSVVKHSVATQGGNLCNEHFSCSGPSAPPCSSLTLYDCNTQSLLEPAVSRNSFPIKSANSNSDNDCHGPHPYRSSFPVSHKRQYSHQIKVVGQHQGNKLPTKVQSKCGSTRGPPHTKNRGIEPMQSFGHYTGLNQEKVDRKNESTLLNALLRSGNIQNPNSSVDYTDNQSVFQKPSSCISPLLCNALKNSEGYFSHSLNKHHFKDASVQLKTEHAFNKSSKESPDTYNHSGYIYSGHSPVVPNTIQNILIANSVHVSDNVPVAVADYGVPTDCSLEQKCGSGVFTLEPTLSSHIQPTISRTSVLSYPTAHNLLVKNCKTQPSSFGVSDILIENPDHYFVNSDTFSQENSIEIQRPPVGTTNDKMICVTSLDRQAISVQNLDLKITATKNVQGNSGYMSDIQNTPSYNPQNPILIFKKNNGLPVPTVDQNLSASTGTSFTFSNRNPGQCTVPSGRNSESNMFTLRSNNNLDTSVEDSNSELETLVPGSWNESEMFSHAVDILPNDVEQSSKALIKSEKSLNVSSINTRAPNTLANSPSMRGRSNSAGNLFSLQHNHINNHSVQGSAATTSSYGSTEILSPMFTNYKGFLCATSPSCSTPSVSEQNDQTAKQALGNSSEERRRQSMQSGLQTLRQLLKMHSNVDNVSGGNRLGGRRNVNSVEMMCSVSGAYTRGDTDMSSEKLSGGLDLGSDEQTISSGNEISSTGRASKAATLRNAAELIRKLRDERNLLEIQCKNLKEEVKALQNAINCNASTLHSR